MVTEHFIYLLFQFTFMLIGSHKSYHLFIYLSSGMVVLVQYIHTVVIIPFLGHSYMYGNRFWL